MTAAPVLEELREVCQPQAKLASRNGEHWAGRLYMRRISLRLTRQLVRTRVTPDQLTWTMVVCGMAAGAALMIPGLTGAVLAVILMQLFLLFDCVDGEVARWTKRTSVTGVYLDRVGHYLSEAALLVGFGLRTTALFGGHPDWLYGFVGTLAALGAILIKAETDLVDVARTRSGLPAVRDEASVPRSSGLALARRAAAALKFHRLVGGVEASLVILAAGIADAVVGGLGVSRVAVVVLAAIAVLQTLLHLVSILASSRLR